MFIYKNLDVYSQIMKVTICTAAKADLSKCWILSFLKKFANRMENNA